MKLDLTKLGLTEDSSFEEIQAKINEQELFSSEDLQAKANESAAAARKAAEAKLKKELGKNTLNDEQIEEYNKYKNDKKLSELKKDKVLSKLNDEDFSLIVKAEGLLSLEKEELSEAIKNVETNYGKRMKNDLPEIVEEEKTENKKEFRFT